jgi:hypothetical protein
MEVSGDVLVVPPQLTSRNASAKSGMMNFTILFFLIAVEKVLIVRIESKELHNIQCVHASTIYTT